MIRHACDSSWAPMATMRATGPWKRAIRLTSELHRRWRAGRVAIGPITWGVAVRGANRLAPGLPVWPAKVWQSSTSRRDLLLPRLRWPRYAMHGSPSTAAGPCLTDQRRRLRIGVGALHS